MKKPWKELRLIRINAYLYQRKLFWKRYALCIRQELLRKEFNEIHNQWDKEYERFYHINQEYKKLAKIVKGA